MDEYSSLDLRSSLSHSNIHSRRFLSQSNTPLSLSDVAVHVENEHYSVFNWVNLISYLEAILPQVKLKLTRLIVDRK